MSAQFSPAEVEAAFFGDEREGEPRDPRTAQERWAHAAMQALAVQCDGAVEEDFQGFNKADTTLGRYLGAFFAAGGQLTDKEWRAAISMCRKYHGQVGACPPAEDGDVFVDEEHEVVTATRKTAREKAAREKAQREAAERKAEADRIREERRRTHPDVRIERRGDTLVVTTPYNADAVRDWRAIPGRRWDGQANVIPYRQARALWALLLKHYRGMGCVGERGFFTIEDTKGGAP